MYARFVLLHAGQYNENPYSSAGRFRVSRNWLENGNELAVSGNVDGRRTGTVNIYSSQDFFMHTFLERLRAKGIHCLSDYSFREFQKTVFQCEWHLIALLYRR